MNLLILLLALTTICSLAGLAIVTARRSDREESMALEAERLRRSLEATMARREDDVRRLIGVLLESIRSADK